MSESFICFKCKEFKPEEEITMVQAKPICKVCLIRNVKSKKRKKQYAKIFGLNYKNPEIKQEPQKKRKKHGRKN